MDKKTWVLLAGLLSASPACATPSPQAEQGGVPHHLAYPQHSFQYPPQEIPSTHHHYVFRNDDYLRIGGVYDQELGKSLDLEKLRPVQEGGDKAYHRSIAQKVYESPAFKAYFNSLQQSLPDSLRTDLPPPEKLIYGVKVSDPLSLTTLPLEQGVQSFFYNTLVGSVFDKQVVDILGSRGNPAAREQALRDDTDYVVITSQPVDPQHYRLVGLSFRVPGI